MKEYPRIHSLSTLGLISHGNRNYPFHPLRTDFTGESGSGKSIIADLLQLILVGAKAFKSSTDTKSQEVRKPTELVLSKSRIGYAFLNIETSIRRFIVIGVYLEKHSSAAKLFVGQNGYEWDKETHLEPLKHPLKYQDFVISDNITHFEALSERLESSQGVVLKSLKRSVYHEILYRNNILPIDLSRNVNKLKDYAQIIRSFSRGEGVKINSEGLKEFLFRDGKETEIMNEFRKRQEQIAINIIEDKKNRDELNIIKTKQEELRYLDSLKKEKEFYMHEWYRFDASYSYLSLDKIKKKKDRLTKERNTLLLMVNYLEGIYNYLVLLRCEDIIREIIQKETFLKNIHEQNKNLDKEIENTQTKLDNKKKRKETLQEAIQAINKLETWIARYDGLANLKKKYNSQATNKKEREKLNEFKSLLNRADCYEKFLSSFWLRLEFAEAEDFYLKESEKINCEIHDLEALQAFSNIEDPNSLASWALNQNREFNRKEESLLMHFQSLSRFKPDHPKKGDRYLPNPHNLYSDPKYCDLEENGYWFNMNGVFEYIPMVKQQLLNSANVKHLKKVLADNSMRITEELEKKREVLQDFRKLKNELYKSGPVEENLVRFQRMKEIESYPNDNELDISYQEFQRILNQFISFEDANDKKKQFKSLTLDCEALEQRLIEYKSQLKINTTEQSKTIDYLKRNNKTDSERERENYSKRLIEIKEKRKQLYEIEEKESVALKALISELALNWIEDESGGGIDRQIKLYDHNRRESLKDSVPSLKTEKLTDLKFKSEEIRKLDQEETEFRTNYENVSRQYEAAFAKKLHKDELTSEKLEKTISEKEKAKQQYLEKRSDFNAEYRKLVSQYKLDQIRFKESDGFLDLAKAILPTKIFELNDDTGKSLNLDERITFYLDEINKKNQQIGSRKLDILLDVFQIVREAYRDYQGTIYDLKRFFSDSDKKITGGYRVRLEPHPSSEFQIDWLHSVIDIIRDRQNDNTIIEKLLDEVQMDEMIIKAYQECTRSNRKPEIADLLNPKSYFRLQFGMEDDNGIANIGSTGQIYSKIALLCIARLSLVERDHKKNRKKGIRFMPIDEAAGLGANYDMLYNIAKAEDYQIISMSVEPIGEFESGCQYHYILTENPDPTEEINYPPFACFDREGGIINIEDFSDDACN